MEVVMTDEKILELLRVGVIRVDPETGQVFSSRNRGKQKPNKPLGTIHAARGYLRSGINYQGKKYFAMLHRIVCIAAHGMPPFSRAQVNHKNGWKRDNRAENLEWVSDSENKRHAMMLRRQPSEKKQGVFLCM